MHETRWTDLTDIFLYHVLTDIFTRFVVGGHITHKESAELAKSLIQGIGERQHIQSGTLTIHADNGKTMVALTVSELMTILGIDKSHSKPYTSNEYSYSESLLKTVKYC